VLWDINEEMNKSTHDELKANGYTQVHPFRVDLTNEEQLKETAKRVREQIGNVSICVMAAAPQFKPKSIMDTNYAQDIEAHFKISYLSQLCLIQQFLRPMIERNHGHFVTISSSSALFDLPLISSYASIKSSQV
jgi:all-trans-retinol dehydrogenase (NAD+)